MEIFKKMYWKKKEQKTVTSKVEYEKLKIVFTHIKIFFVLKIVENVYMEPDVLNINVIHDNKITSSKLAIFTWLLTSLI